MSIEKEEAVPVARLVDGRSDRTVDWVYRWNTSELSILWLDPKRTAHHIDPPPLSRNTIANAKTVTTDEVTDLLEELSLRGGSADLL